MKKHIAFTLVELIVVIAVLAILAVVSFTAVGNITSSARDSARLTDISSIKTSLESYNSTKGTYPLPDNISAISWSGNLAWNQGTFGDTVTRTLGNISRPKDPKWGVDYSYSVVNSKKEYEIATVLEKATSFNKLQKTYAQGEKYEPTIKGNYNGIALRVSSNISTWILSVPTIIASDIKDAKLENIIFSLAKSANIPASYVGKITSAQSIGTFTPIQIWSGVTLPISNTDFQTLTTNLQTAYTGTTVVNTNTTVQSLLSKSGVSDLQDYGKKLVDNVLKQSGNADKIPTYSYSWTTGGWGWCSASCGAGTQYRTVSCMRNDSVSVATSYCGGGQPTTSQGCSGSSCGGTVSGPNCGIYTPADACNIWCSMGPTFGMAGCTSSWCISGCGVMGNAACPIVTCQWTQ